MNSGEEIPELRLAPPDTPEQLAERAERERRRREDVRQMELSNSLKPFRVGSVPYLNSVPLTRGLEDEILFLPPAQLAEKLRANELDAALLSITEVLFHDCYDVLDGIAVASLGEVFSVYLAHKIPLDQIRRIHCDAASLTSVNLLKVILAEYGIEAELLPLTDYATAPDLDAVLLIGNPAIAFRRETHPHTILDLGAAWHDLTGLPFVYAIWALRRDVENERLKRQLREARDFGLDTLDHIIASRADYDLDFRKDYLGWHIHFHMGSDEKRGIARFIELLRKHGIGPVYDPVFVA
ncbi:MAG: menaquinone biosynthesis protein [Verrucomicrobiae bacterium]|nr:menaquinone biosynthesis protein [Verrucomicrobiae bacterium]